MASTITTTGTTPVVSTQHESGESVRGWVARHNVGVAASTPGAKLETKWTASSGDQKVETGRLPGESDADFRARHMETYLLVMVEQPPVP